MSSTKSPRRSRTKAKTNQKTKPNTRNTKAAPPSPGGLHCTFCGIAGGTGTHALTPGQSASRIQALWAKVGDAVYVPAYPVLSAHCGSRHHCKKSVLDVLAKDAGVRLPHGTHCKHPSVLGSYMGQPAHPNCRSRVYKMLQCFEDVDRVQRVVNTQVALMSPTQKKAVATVLVELLSTQQSAVAAPTTPTTTTRTTTESSPTTEPPVAAPKRLPTCALVEGRTRSTKRIRASTPVVTAASVVPIPHRHHDHDHDHVSEPSDTFPSVSNPAPDGIGPLPLTELESVLFGGWTPQGGASLLSEPTSSNSTIKANPLLEEVDDAAFMADLLMPSMSFSEEDPLLAFL